MKKEVVLGLMLAMSFYATADENNESLPLQNEAPIEQQVVQEDISHGGFVPFKRKSGSYSYSSQSSYSSHSSQLTPSCLALLRQKYGQGYIETSEAIRKASIDQTRTQGLVALGYGAVTGTALGFATGNPVLGVGWGLGSAIFGGIGQSIERGKISKNGNTVLAAEKILSGQELTKKERKAFEDMRRKTGRKGYKDKNALSDKEFANIVYSQGSVGEKLFCDVENGKLKLLPKSSKTITRLAADAKCKYPVTSNGAVAKELQKKNRSNSVPSVRVRAHAAVHY